MRMRAGWARAALALATLSVAVAPHHPESAPEPEPELELVVSAVAWAEGAGGGEALAELVRAALGGRARTAPAPVECAAAGPDAGACSRAALGRLAAGELHALLLPLPGAALPAPARLRDAGLEAGGALEAEAEGSARRGCWARGELRALPELAEAERARRYRATREDVAALAEPAAPPPRYFCGTFEAASSEAEAEAEEEEGRAEPCAGADTLATVLVGSTSEARVVRAAARAHGLRLQAVALGAGWNAVRALRALRARRVEAVLCGRALDGAALRAEGARLLGPPPCLAAGACPFDPRPLLKLSAARAMASAPAARRALERLALPPGGARALASRARAVGAAKAAREALALAQAQGGDAPREVRVAVLLPLSTRREVADARALRAAAELAEEDEAEAAARRGDRVRFKVELVDSGCAATRAFKYLTDALGSEFEALSGVAGGACAGAFGAVAQQSAALALPVLAYAPQAGQGAEAGEGGPLLAAGDAREALPALAALLAALGWRRAALLSEAGGRAALEPARLGVEVLVHVELPEGEELAEELVERWAARAAALEARVLLVAAEDARAARAALCAGAARGLTPRAGAVYVMLGAMPDAAPDGACPLADQLEGHLRLTAEWAARWQEEGAAGAGRWARRWRARARAAPAAPPPAAAALLYDALRLWAGALARLLRAQPHALDDLHRKERVASLMQQALGTPYAGLTGAFEWEGRARAGGLRLQQWCAGAAASAGRWAGAAGGLTLRPQALRWRTPGGAAPDDGAEARCPWRGLARALGASCGATGGVLAALALLALLAALGGAAWRWRRAAARRHRARLRALGMRALGAGAGSPDRWELPRERVVINRKLGAGAFGAVYGGHALLGAGAGRWAAVAVKTLKAGATTEEKLDFLSEAEAMKRFSHERVVRLLGVVTRSEPVCTVMEYMLYGDLKGWLVARRHLAGPGAEAGAREEVAPERLTGMARDAALGLAYLARLRYVHRDVAARNCLVGAARRVKLADFGLTRVVFENDYYRFGRKGMLPVRWMAPESVALGVFSAASDVWAFGVLLYEIVTFGALPHHGLPNAQVVQRVKAGCAPPLPPALGAQLEALIQSCWRVERRARPTAAALAAALAQSPRLLAPSLATTQAPDALGDPLPSQPEGRWVSWAEAGAEAEAEAEAGTDCTYLSAEAGARLAPADTDPFLPPDAC